MSDDNGLPSPKAAQFDWSPLSDRQRQAVAQRLEARAREIAFGTANEVVPADTGDLGIGPTRVDNITPPTDPRDQPNDTIIPPPFTVVDPEHYRSHPSGVECIEITEHLGFCIGNAIKYLWRAGLKDGTDTGDDLRKAVWYINRELKRLGLDG